MPATTGLCLGGKAMTTRIRESPPPWSTFRPMSLHLVSRYVSSYKLPAPGRVVRPTVGEEKRRKMEHSDDMRDRRDP
jgi:hypothetical protein